MALISTSLQWLAGGIAAALLASAAHAGQSELTIRASVPKIVRAEVLSQPGTLTVSEEDVRRGFVEVAAPMHVAVRANTDNYALVFTGAGDLVKQARMQGLGSTIQFDGTGAMVPQRSSGRRPSQPLVHELRFRFMLAAHAVPGAHPWPLQVSAMPL